jgi:hydrogenase-4 component B
MSVVLAIGYAGLAASVLAAALSARVAAAAAAVAAALIGAVGISTAAAYGTASVSIGSWLGFGPASLVSDRLAGIFLAATGVVGAGVSVALLERGSSRLVAALHALILLAICAVIGTDQAFVFLLAWETITLSLYLLGAADRDRPGTLVAGYFAGGMSKLGGAALLAAFGLLYAKTGSFELSVWAQQASHLGNARDAAFVLFVIAFGTKLGLIPFQGPLPALYAAAPGPSAATVSIAFNAAFYGLWRLVFSVLAPAPLWWGELLVSIGALTALIGILYAIAQDGMRRFLGFSSVEHGGIATVGLGVALVGQAAHLPKLAAAGLLAATLHLLMHCVAKALAFVAADRVSHAAGQDDLRPLGGLAAVLPATAVGFGVAVLTLAAMPFFGGFVSEWLTFMALLQAFRVHDTIAELVLALGGAFLALTAGIALLAFAKLFGGIFLGRAREALAVARERRIAFGLGALTVLALAVGPIAPWEIRWLGHGLEGVLGFDLGPQAVTFPLVLGPVYQGFSVLSPTWDAAGIAAFALTAVLLVRLVLRPRVRRAPVWVSGTAAPIASVQYTPDAYANPIRVVLAGLYGFRRTIERRTDEQGREIAVARTRVVPAFEDYLYRPIANGSVLLAAQARRLQSGRLGNYVLYVLAVLLAVLALIPALTR